ncbi:MAG TPA: DUF5606 domain-containing protein [Flavisolibacter sp.]|nr:DUF5606 domain-containing protein [Flavisolibacter sp.]
MDYNRIVAVTGMPGLYEVLSSKTDGAIVRSLEDKSTKFVSSRIHNLSHLESIEIYTVKENVTLADVFSSMKESKSKLPDTKDNKALKAYFEKVYPDLDFERVYASDMKKMVKWYEVLSENGIDFTIKAEANQEEEAEPVAEVITAPAEEATGEKKPKARAKKAAAPAAEAADATETEKPKKAPRKKKAEE